MAKDFQDWDAGLHRNDPDSLEHYGIPGMKWGVRRFQNADGSLTKRGERRYGALGRGGGARAMTRHLNKLDKGYANVEARRRSAAANAARKAYRMNKALSKGKTKKAEKLQKKAIKSGMKAAALEKTKGRIENLQWRIIAKAAQKGYTTNSQAVKRAGQDGKTRIAQALGGIVGRAIYSSVKKGKNTATVDGQEYKVSRRGDRSTNVVNYNAAKNERVKQIFQEERDKERAKQLKGTRR